MESEACWVALSRVFCVACAGLYVAGPRRQLKNIYPMFDDSIVAKWPYAERARSGARGLGGDKTGGGMMTIGAFS